MPETKNGNPFAVLDLPALSDRDLLERCLPFRHDTLSTRIANDKRIFILIELCRIKQITQLAFIHRRTHDHIGDTAHIGDIISAMMCWPVLTHQPGSVQTEHDRQLLDRYIMDHLIIRPLHKRRIDIAKDPHSLRRHPGTQSHSMLLTY